MLVSNIRNIWNVKISSAPLPPVVVTPQDLGQIAEASTFTLDMGSLTESSTEELDYGQLP